LRLGAFALVFIHHWLHSESALWPALGSSVVTRWAIGSVAGFGRGVDLFFTLSAFLITELLLRETERYGTLDVRAFWTRRALRIWPLYFAALAVAVVVWPRFTGWSFGLGNLAAFVALSGNWAVAWWGYPASPFRVLWSVSIEEQFYLVWPLVIRKLGARRLAACCIALVAVAVLTRAYLAARHAPATAVWPNTFARLDLFAAGGLLALALRRRTPTPPTALRWALLVAGLGTFAALGIADAGSGWRSVAGYSAGALASVAIIVALYGVRIPTTRRSAKAALFLGRISYGLYVFHALALTLATHALTAGLARFHTGPVAITLAIGALGAGLTVLMAGLSYRWLESPFLRLKTRFARVQSRAT
jgi:peptidoglycan/LPS O-acetylase OafA/YrhL